jgi:hypothetical protein
MISVAPSPFEVLATREGYSIAPAVLPAANRTYADRDTQAAFDAWVAGAHSIARMLTESTLETEALRERIQAIALPE